MFYNYKIANLSGIQSNYKHAGTKQQSSKISEANTDRVEGRNNQFGNNRWTRQDFTFNNRQNNSAKDQGNKRLDHIKIN